MKTWRIEFDWCNLQTLQVVYTIKSKPIKKYDKNSNYVIG